MSKIQDLYSNLNIIQNIKNDLRQAIVNKGQNITNITPFNMYAPAIENISGGGTVEGVKQFPNVEAMNASVGNIEGDLAIVYTDSTRNINESDILSSVIFPDTVVLPTAVLDSISARFATVDSSQSFTYNLSGTIGTTSASFTYGQRFFDTKTVSYTSSDGITYTRTDSIGNPVEFPVEFKIDTNYTFNPITGYFIQVGSTSFNGLYQYTSNIWQFAPSQLDASPEYVFDKIYYGSNGVETGTLQSVTGLNKSRVEFRRNIRNLYSNMSVSDASYFFNNNKTITSFDPTTSVSDLVFENLINTSYMFNGCSNLTSVSNMDTSNVTNMRYMLAGCSNLTSIPNFNTGNVTDLSYLLYGCRNLTSVPSFDTSNATNMLHMFIGCYNLLSVPNFDTSNVTDMGGMFSSCRMVTDVPNFDTSKVINMGGMFYGAYNVTNISNFDTSNVTNMENMFYSCNHLVTVPEFDTSNVTGMDQMFNGCTSLVNVPQFNISNITSIRYMFVNCNNLSNASIQNIINMCLNSNITNQTLMNLKINNWYSPLYNTKFDNSYYSNRLAELTAAGWTY